MIQADKVLTEAQLTRLIKIMKEEKQKAVVALLSSAKKPRNDVRIIIDYFLIALISNTGLRISEALNLFCDDIHKDFLVIREEVSKNGKKGTVYFGNRTRKLIDEWLELRIQLKLLKGDGKLLFSLKTKPSSRSYIHTRFKMWLSRTGLPMGLSLHSLRHTYGTLCLDKGLPLTFVRDNLRHSNISITSQYLHLTKENRDKVKDLF